MKKQPSLLGKWLLWLLLEEEDYKEMHSNFVEAYQSRLEENGRLRAYGWYWFILIKSIPPFLYDTVYWRMTMIRNYLLIALRNMKRQKTYTLINISGLAVGLACCILMFLWIHNELSFDKFHENFNDLYRVISVIPTSNETTFHARTANAVGPTLVEQYPEVVNYTRYQGFEGTLIEANDVSLKSNYFAVADPAFFQMFSFNFIKGDPNTVFENKFSIVITESMARKFYGNDDPVGQILNVQMGRNPFLVTGVIEDMPENSHIHFECIMPFIVCKDWYHAEPLGWDISMYYTYVQLKSGSDVNDLKERIRDTIKCHNKTSLAEVSLQPLGDIHLKSKLTGDLDNYKKGDIKTIYIYCITALSILVIASINFINLSTARASRRAKEVGLRKVIGAQKRQLIKQFMGESVLLAGFSLIVALVLVRLLLPTFNTLTDKNLALNLSIHLRIWIGVFLISVTTGLISGIYPAIYLSALKPVHALKAEGVMKSGSGFILRKLLVITQFVFSVILIAGTIVIYNQLNFIKNKSLGYDNKSMVIPSSYFNSTIKNELLENPAIVSIAQGDLPSRELRGNSSFTWEGKDTDYDITLYPLRVGESYLEAFGMTMKEGRFFSREFGSDDDKVIINETAAMVMELTNPIGIKVNYEIMNMETGRLEEKNASIIGVMKDFHQTSLHNPIEPMVFEFAEWHYEECIKIKPDNVQQTLKFIEDTYKNHVDYPYTYTFLEEKTEAFYAKDKKTASVFSYFSLLAVFLSCLGLFGLASYTTEQRRKEIGIRKVIGSSITKITVLLSMDFLKSVMISLIVAFPIAWMVMNQWLNGFAYRVRIGVFTLILAGLMATLTAFLSIAIQIIKAARANPVDSLRNE